MFVGGVLIPVCPPNCGLASVLRLIKSNTELLLYSLSLLFCSEHMDAHILLSRLLSQKRNPLEPWSLLSTFFVHFSAYFACSVLPGSAEADFG